MIGQKWGPVCFASLGVWTMTAPVQAQSFYDPHPLAEMVSEFRFGLQAHAVHHAALPFLVNEWNVSHVEDVSFDVLFSTPDLDVFRWFGAPRPEVGATVSLAGRDSIAHAALTWQLPVFDTPLYLEGTFGAAIHNGYLTGAPTGRANLGCRVNFYERFGIGMNLAANVTATFTYEHTSNNEWCAANDGLSNFGLRVGWQF